MIPKHMLAATIGTWLIVGVACSYSWVIEGVITIPLAVQEQFSAPILIDADDPDGNPDAIPLPDLPPRYDCSEWNDLVRGYNAEAARQLEQLPASAFTPDLTLLGALIASLRVEPEGWRRKDLD